MKLITAFFQLIRWHNVVFIVFTQALFYFCVYQSIYFTNESLNQLVWLIIASAFISSAGYIINDYFDLNIDHVNKPGKNVINKIISRRWAIALHLAFSVSGLVATLMAVSLDKWYLVLANLICIILLWLYSTSFKRQAIVGNLVISVLTAWTILILFFTKVPFSAAFSGSDELTIKFFRISFLYAGFAFIISLIREAIKDVEDIEGDRKYGCKTLPIIAGVTATKIYTTVWIVVLIASLIISLLYVLLFTWWWAAIYSAVFILIPLLSLFRRHYKARSTADFRQLSRMTKWIMFTGILSMIFLRIYS